MRKFLAVLVILLVAASLTAREPGRRESGFGISYARFILGNDLSAVNYEGYGLEFFSNNRFAGILGFGSSSNYYYFTKRVIENSTYFFNDSELAVGLTALLGPSLEINLGTLGFQVLGGVGLDVHYWRDDFGSANYIGLLYGGDARVLIGFTRNFRLYAGAGATYGFRQLTSDYNSDFLLDTLHATIGLQVAR